MLTPLAKRAVCPHSGRKRYSYRGASGIFFLKRRICGKMEGRGWLWGAAWMRRLNGNGSGLGSGMIFDIRARPVSDLPNFTNSLEAPLHSEWGHL